MNKFWARTAIPEVKPDVATMSGLKLEGYIRQARLNLRRLASSQSPLREKTAYWTQALQEANKRAAELGVKY